MSQQSTNTFINGINKDQIVWSVPNTNLTDCINCELITSEGNEGDLQNIKGNLYKTLLKENYVPVVVKELNGISYIISAEYDK